jgi:hypothetical protein
MIVISGDFAKPKLVASYGWRAKTPDIMNRIFVSCPHDQYSTHVPWLELPGS